MRTLAAPSDGDVAWTRNPPISFSIITMSPGAIISFSSISSRSSTSTRIGSSSMPRSVRVAETVTSCSIRIGSGGGGAGGCAGGGCAAAAIAAIHRQAIGLTSGRAFVEQILQDLDDAEWIERLDQEEDPEDGDSGEPPAQLWKDHTGVMPQALY